MGCRKKPAAFFMTACKLWPARLAICVKSVYNESDNE